MKKTVNVTVTGGAGQISYSLLFRIASGQMLGDDQPINLHLLEITPALKTLKGVEMELLDCAFPLLNNVLVTDKAEEAFKDSHYALLVGARPRSSGMERKDLLAANAAIFSVQGKVINDYADRNVKVLVVGNPANTNALIVKHNAPEIPSCQLTAMTRLDHNRAISLVAEHLHVSPMEIKNISIWGNHSATQYPDLHDATINGKAVMEQIDKSWYKDVFIPQVQQRGATIIEARGFSSAASAASAAIDHMYDWVHGTPADNWVSMGVYTDDLGLYEIEDGLIYSFPCYCKDGKWEIVKNLNIGEFSRAKMLLTQQELINERNAIADLL